jgi:glycosyltransferase 2 family protein
MRLKRINWRLVFGVAVSVLALALILKDVSLPELASELSKGNYWWLIPTTLISIVGMYVRAIRWRALLDNRLPLSRSFHIQNASNYLNNILPLRLGELGKAYLATRNSTITTMQSLSTVLIERLLDVLSVFVMLMIVLPFVPAGGIIVPAGITAASIAVAGVIGLFVAAAFRERAIALARALTGRLPERFREALLSRGDDFLLGVQSAGGKRLAAAVFWSVILWICWGGISVVMLNVFIVGAPWYWGIFATCAVGLGLSIPSAPSGAGLYEAAVVAALAIFGISTSAGFAYALVTHIFTFVSTAVFGIIGLDREGESFGHFVAAAQNMLSSSRKK